MCVVHYTGHDTKAMKNSSGPRYKRSKLERHMNRDVLWCLIILLFLCFFSAVGMYRCIDAWLFLIHSVGIRVQFCTFHHLQNTLRVTSNRLTCTIIQHNLGVKMNSSPQCHWASPSPEIQWIYNLDIRGYMIPLITVICSLTIRQFSALRNDLVMDPMIN